MVWLKLLDDILMKKGNYSLKLFIFNDLLTVGLGWFCFNIIRYFVVPHIGEFSHGLYAWLMYPQVILGQILVPITMVLLYSISGAYNTYSSIRTSRLEASLNTLATNFVGVLGIYFAVLMNDRIPERLANYEIILILFGLLTVPTLFGRILLVKHNVRRLTNPVFQTRALIVGAVGKQKHRVAKLMKAAYASGLNIVGLVDMEGIGNKCSINGLTVSSDWKTEIERPDIEALVFLHDVSSDSRNSHFVDKLYGLKKTVYITPDYYGLLSMKPRLTSVLSEPLVELTGTRIAPGTANIKRLSDVIISSIALVALIPLYAVLAILIPLDSPGSPFYRQERMGMHGKPFKIIKFRTMFRGAENEGPALSSEDDKRITRLGRFLRKYRIDEFPQFWNVLVGDMSLVGPRPEREYYIRQILQRHPSYVLLHQVRPGITSWGMVKYGYASNVEQMCERLSYDLLYIQNIGIAIDLKILLHTVSTVLKGKGL